MKKLHLSVHFIFLVSFSAVAQSMVQGKVVHIISKEPVPRATISIEDSSLKTITDENGLFFFPENTVPFGSQTLLVEAIDYVPLRISISVQENTTINLDPILLELDFTTLEAQLGVIRLSADDLLQDEDANSNTSGLLQATRDVFLNASAYDFSATFFKPRGLDNANGEVLINGMKMNEFYSGRPQWSTWGGLNDAQRNREFSVGLQPNHYTFGDVAGTTNLIMRASQFRKGGQISYAYANRSYEGRAMGSYHSGLTKSGWAYSVLASRRYGEEGYVEGTFYDANSFYAAIEKKVGEQHSFNLMGFYAPNRRGRSTALTKEAQRLRGIRYNPHWGFQNGSMRSSRVRDSKIPVIQLNHFWELSNTTQLNTNIGFQFGTQKNSRIDNNGTRLVTAENGDSYFVGGARSVLGNYYQRLPSYFLRNPNPTAYDFQLAYQAQQDFIQNGQIEWHQLYRANTDADGNPKPATYVLQNDVVETTQWAVNSILNSQWSDALSVTAKVSYRKHNSANYAEIGDLLGSSGYLDIDSFTEASTGDESGNVQLDLAQSDLRNPNRIALQGERYKYNFLLEAQSISGFLQTQISSKRASYFVGIFGDQTSFQRTGLYENGNYPNDLSFGAGDLQAFTTYGLKGGGSYTITGRHVVEVNTGYFTKPPTLRNTYSNPRQNHAIIDGLEVVAISSADLSYYYRSPVLKARLTGYYISFSNETEIGFYFTENISGLGRGKDAFVQEVTSNIASRRMGGELGIEAQLTPTFKLKAAGAFGVHTYQNNPNVFLTSDDFEAPVRFGDGTTKLKNYRIPGGPQRAYQVGLEYRDPDYWWFGLTGNYFSHAYIDVNNLARSTNFSTDSDGLPFNDYNAEVAETLLKQEQFDPYILVNAVGGKSWRLKKYYFGFFASVSNILNNEYITGGFEQGRYSNYRNKKTDAEREYGPLFGNRYFFGNGTTYFINAFVRF